MDLKMKQRRCGVRSERTRLAAVGGRHHEGPAALGNCPDRMIQRIQRQLQSVEATDGSVYLTAREIAELEARIRRIHEMGDRFNHVRLSGHVASLCVTNVLDRVGGGVAREV